MLTRMVDIEVLARRFIELVGTLKSAEVACTFLNGIEGWFRIELVPILVDMGGHNIGPRHAFPGQQSADLYLTMQGHLCVFEVMCLVDGSDANKLKRFPGQLDRLQHAVEDRSICQGIAFVTFNYPRTGTAKVPRLVREFFGPRGWKQEGPRPLYRDCPLQLHLASVTAGSCRHGGARAEPAPPGTGPPQTPLI